MHMVLELQHQVPLLYVCFCNPNADANSKAGYPFPDSGGLV
ncbi:hypothetical protein [Sporisorium scitamineum]|uniref:Uncharacterized protein n=1 Tax=Sporisorium scitamineum TaxID=49012 RepID=A0A0F7RRI1_9BASI|nr:hypothetical protein [Sporisorium scitamineum]